MKKHLIVLLTAAVSIAAMAQAPAAPPVPSAPPAPQAQSAQVATELQPKTKLDFSAIELPLTQEKAAAMEMALLHKQIEDKYEDAATKEFQSRAAEAQDTFNHAEVSVKAWVDKVKKDNGWGDDVELDRRNRKFYRVPGNQSPVPNGTAYNQPTPPPAPTPTPSK